MTTSTPPATVPTASTRRRQPIVPPYHGAWGFLGLPVVMGIAAAGWSPWLPLLVVTWVAAYPMSWALTGTLTARRRGRFRRALLIWGPLCVLGGAPLLLVHPWLLWSLAAYGLLFAVNVQQAGTRRERSLVNDLVLIVECALLVPLLAGVVADRNGFALPVGAMTTGPVVAATVAVGLTLVGSTLHVKSLIRERTNPTFARVSRCFSLLAPAPMLGVCLATGASGWLAAAFLFAAARSIWAHDPTWRPARIGMVELVCLMAVALTGLMVLPS
ncbi:YwiC-like family protein [Nocardioides humilatus]|uniref:YwiC-like family protein n=1 Tax=Nocardioides humilatus TaxID=2607660 RepID=A0A5B1LBZ8_9ACTN|nr:YwiC-like family protein [Nocardioides humilatus]KAA1417804.1 YwiC-like family protein [Nocardioides humilatus]